MTRVNTNDQKKNNRGIQPRYWLIASSLEMLGFSKGNNSNTVNIKHHFHFNVSPGLLVLSTSTSSFYLSFLYQNFLKSYNAKTTKESFIHTPYQVL